MTTQEQAATRKRRDLTIGIDDKQLRKQRDSELEDRVTELETRLGEVIAVLAGVSKAGGWLKRQHELGERA